jgi:hypothetical protein
VHITQDFIFRFLHSRLKEMKTTIPPRRNPKAPAMTFQGPTCSNWIEAGRLGRFSLFSWERPHDVLVMTKKYQEIFFWMFSTSASHILGIDTWQHQVERNVHDKWCAQMCQHSLTHKIRWGRRGSCYMLPNSSRDLWLPMCMMLSRLQATTHIGGNTGTCWDVGDDAM